MPQEFDPYYRWLVIPPAEQPADYYRLLGLSRFENEPEVIRDAAERQMAHVRRYALGKHRDLSQQMRTLTRVRLPKSRDTSRLSPLPM